MCSSEKVWGKSVDFNLNDLVVILHGMSCPWQRSGATLNSDFLLGSHVRINPDVFVIVLSDNALGSTSCEIYGYYPRRVCNSLILIGCVHRGAERLGPSLESTDSAPNWMWKDSTWYCRRVDRNWTVSYCQYQESCAWPSSWKLPLTR